MLYYSLSSSKSLSVDCASIQLSSSAVTRPLAVTLPTKICWISGCLPAATLAPVLSIYASKLWIDLNFHLEHRNATSETIVAGVLACRHVRGLYTKYEQHSSSAQAFHMGPSISTGDDLPSVPNAAVDHITCDAEVWFEHS